MISLKDRLLSDENIYLAIYSVNSYISNKELLNCNDRNKLYQLSDKFNYKVIFKTIKDVKERLKQIIIEDDYLTAKVYFKPKRYEKEESKSVVFRPIHTSCLVEQIATIAMLNILVYKIDENKKISLSNLSRLIPDNFFGNKISTDVEVLFEPWYKQYQKYTSKANELFKRYHESQDYKWEVDLDLTNFFPSINPVSLYNYILTKLDVNMSENEAKLIRKILEKLIFIKLQNSDVNELQLYKEKTKDSVGGSEICIDNNGFVIGIPQGLPHTYFLANICMKEVQKIYQKHIPGEMLFYVDDSVIFTNAIIDYNDFDNKIIEINKSIEQWQIENFNTNENSFSSEVKEYINSNNFKDYFSIQVHKAGDKSTITNILDSKDGEAFLSNIGRESSKTAFDINSMYSDEESYILYNRTKIILEMLENEIELQSSKKSKNKNARKAYLKKLIRYKKFFKNRFLSLEYRIESDDSKFIEKFKEKYEFLEKDSDKESKLKKFFDEYSEDVFEPTVNFVLKKLYEMQKKDDIKWILNRIENINDILFDFPNTNSSYLYETYKKYYEYINSRKYSIINVDRYNSLKEMIGKNLMNTANKSDLAIAKSLEVIFESINNNNLQIEFIKKILGNKLFKIMSIVINNTEQIIRMILNASFSYICRFDINDNLYLMKKNYRKITYTELRLLVYLRNKRFKLEEFLVLYKDFFKNDYNTGIDYTILQVIKIFKTFIGNPKSIDNLILVHKYTCDIWKNGSKYLYFYTLHNQEHAVDLIQNILKIIRAIDYIQISANDYYILFIACYLHDISMTTMPNLDSIQSSTLKADKIYTDFINEIKRISKDRTAIGNVKKLLKDYYCKLDEFYEDLVRSNHTKDSAKEIRSRYEFKFIEAGLREIVAEVSEAHGYNVNEIYKIKSTAKNKLVSSKFDKILLRLADLLDMNSYRISKTILNHNLDSMNKVSRFHWISHLITVNCNIETNYDLSPKAKINDSFLLKKNYCENIIFHIKVKLPQFSKVKSIGCKDMDLDECENNSLTLICGKECRNNNCNFLCKWFAIKNKFLFMELNALKDYLESLLDNFFGVNIKVIVESEENTNLTAEQFDALKEFLDD